MSRLKEDMTYCGTSLKKESLWFFLYSLPFLAAEAGFYVWKGISFLLLFPVLGYLGFAFFFFTRYGAMRRKRIEELGNEFVHLFSFFAIYINDGFNVYNALENILPFASDTMRKLLQALLKGIDEDKSVTPFVTFASKLEDIAIKEVMMSAYQMIDEGSGGAYIAQFQHLFGKLSDARHEKERKTRLERLQSLSFLPLAGSGLAMLTLTLCIVEIMGGLMDVL